jgi:hypothetical protein
VKVLRFRAGFPQTGRSSQIADELQIFREEVRLHFPKARRQQPGVPIQTFPEGPFFVARGWAMEAVAEQSVERLLEHAQRMTSAPGVFQPIAHA